MQAWSYSELSSLSLSLSLSLSPLTPSLTHRVVLPNSYPWQTYMDKLDQPPPGSAMAVAQHILASILTQFADRRLFLYLFGHDHGKNAKSMFTATINSLASMEGEAPSDQGGDKNPPEDKLYKWSPIKYFLEDAQSLNNFQSGVKKHSLINLAIYVEILQEHLAAGNVQLCPLLLTRDIVLWDNFLKKLRTHTDVLRDSKAMQSLLQIFVLFLQNIVDSSVVSGLCVICTADEGPHVQNVLLMKFMLKYVKFKFHHWTILV